MGIKVLVVDDNSFMRGFLVNLIKKEKNVTEVLQAENGQVALEVIDAKKPNVVVIDVEMPVMDGLEALRHIKELKKTKKIDPKMKTIVLSGTMFENDANVRKAKFLGANEVMAKPKGKSMAVDIDSMKLLKAINEPA